MVRAFPVSCALSNGLSVPLVLIATLDRPGNSVDDLFQADAADRSSFGIDHVGLLEPCGGYDRQGFFQNEVVRQAESQTSSTEDRITFITQRLEAAMDTAAGRVAAFESGLELELSTKLTEFERAVRHAEQSVGREAG